ncbi:Pimeloyl-ACP methyl ester carboxylesterase [Actinopolymorpha cephalotaxi]|uniref:Pimeloyl-ACP methyl ester carboxylesterase n=1 Tax=Actinopolymorpha cephalotaxi TaxID=504797 RepID=A0A1I2XEU7_9ACTN|nr:alpha/beta fold hydrolase [Actinopolymorpha cephalotaxi]NYH86181.1 pimeloyl-ACP methyl ester carboxylesterase [Actinopolymorpha cephalotaxi]SFH11186.1 Pimeloyl-ACP methyl ester carboxylesterase [Actinopolymorpha cephalotaxi]
MPEHLFVDVGKVRLAYRVVGDPEAPPLVLLHGVGSDGSSWDPVVPGLARDWRVFVPDLRGFGRSDWPGDYSFELMAADLLGFLDALDLDRAVLAGHSMGGVVCYLLAQDHPDRVSALVLVETPPPLPQHRPEPQRPDEQDGPLGYDWPVRPAIVGQVNRPDPRWWHRLAEIAAPALVVAGGPTSPFSQEEIAAMAARLPAAQLVTVAVGHGVHKEAPEEFLAVVCRFLAGVRLR